ncbi:MAG: hypothetical protein HRT87_02195 [Legionellales bacterium]|nr:hypothetical protein [Legionellales bacterium]
MKKAELNKKLYSEALKIVKFPEFDPTAISKNEKKILELLKRKMMEKAINDIYRNCVKESNDEYTFTEIKNLDEATRAIINLETLKLQNYLCRQLLKSITPNGCNIDNEKYYLVDKKFAYGILDNVTTHLKKTYDELVETNNKFLENSFIDHSKRVHDLNKLTKKQIQSLNISIPEVEYDPIASYNPIPLIVGAALSIVVGAICVATGGIGAIVLGVCLLGFGVAGGFGAIREMRKKSKYFEKQDESYLAQKELDQNYNSNYDNMRRYTGKLGNEINKQSTKLQIIQKSKRGMTKMKQLSKKTNEHENVKTIKHEGSSKLIDDSIVIKENSHDKSENDEQKNLQNSTFHKM